MEIVLHIRADFKCVYLLNGSFVENADAVKYGGGEPIYITALPLNAHFLPYTVKVLNGRALSNEPLASVYSLGQNNYYVRLRPRRNYVYSSEHREAPVKRGGAEGFFFKVKCGDLSGAREHLTDALNASIDDGALRAFFDEYTDILHNTFTAGPPSSYFLIDGGGAGTPFNFVMNGKLIDNIVSIKN
jgi:hypothetical protein